MWGIPNFDFETLEDRFITQSDGLWGVCTFKRNFGGKVAHSISARDRIYNPLLYYLYKFNIRHGNKISYWKGVLLDPIRKISRP